MDEEDFLEIEFLHPGPLFPIELINLLQVSITKKCPGCHPSVLKVPILVNDWKCYSNELKLMDASLVLKKN